MRFMARMLGCRAGFRLALALCGTCGAGSRRGTRLLHGTRCLLQDACMPADMHWHCRRRMHVG